MATQRNTKICIICSKAFYAPPSSKKLTCSRECSTKNRKQLHICHAWNEEAKQRLKKKGQTPNLQLGVAAVKLSLIGGSFETNQEAKEWCIQSPDGLIYEFRNLRLWAKNNGHLFDNPNPDTIAHGFYALKRSLQGKTQRPHNHYKGWLLLNWGE